MARCATIGKAARCGNAARPDCDVRYVRASSALNPATVRTKLPRVVPEDHELLAALDEALCVAELTPEGTIMAANENYARLFGYSTSQLIGRSRSALLPFSERRSPEQAALWRSLARGQRLETEFRAMRRTGGDVWIRGSYHPVMDANGTLTRVIELARNITDKVAALYDLQERLRAVQRSSAILVVTPDGDIVSATPKFLEILGRTESELSDTLYAELLPEQRRFEHAELWERLLDGNTEDGEFVHLAPDGTELWVRATYCPTRDSTGRVVAIEVHAQDATTEKRATTALDQLGKALERSTYIAEFSPQGTIQRANRRFLSILGYGQGEIVGRHHEIFVAEEESESAKYRQFWDNLRQGVFQAGEFERFDKRGKPVWIRGSYNPVFNLAGEVEKIVKVAFDVTAQKQAEEDLKRRTVELEHARNSAEEAARAKSSFLARMSHEIRTPLNGVIGLANLVLQGQLEPPQREQMETLVDCGEGLLDVINELLDFSKLEAGKMEYEHAPFRLIDSVRQIVAVFQARAESKGLVLAFEVADGVPDVVMGDAARVRQIVTNLVGNALKFCEEGGVTVRLRRGYQVGWTEIDVHDTGVGISTAAQETLFEAFQQGDRPGRGGTGLGLTISKEFAEGMGGSLACDSKVGSGSTFTVKLPLPATEEPAPARPSGWRKLDPTTAERYPLSVLIVDDNAVNRLVAERLFRRMGYSPVVAQNGQEALAQFESRPFDLSLVDLNMPVMGGMDFVAEARRRELSGWMVACTADVLEETRRACLEAGYHAVLAKPIELSRVAEVLVDAFQHSGAAGEAA
ncbi:MAG: PAS domain S-box protein [Myxococcales bacterium FL481]|nr:MAG: PAS domain S-box protein [Myxococcales bacterium FL481]